MKRFLSTILLAMVASSPAPAAFFCVVNAAQLEAALDAAESNNEDDIIAIQSATYLVPAGGFDYFPAASDENNDLEIIGGYGPNIGGPCQSGPFPDATLTILDGDDANQILTLGLPEEGGDIEIRNLLFSSGSSGGNGGALRVDNTFGNPFPGRLAVINNIFLANTGFIGGALFIRADGTSSMDIEVLNNLFVANDADSVSGALQITAFAPPPSSSGPVLTSLPAVSFAHNTVINNNNELANVGGVRLSGDIPNVWVAGNNIWDNEGTNLQIQFESDNTVRLVNNNLQNISASNPPGLDSGNIGVAPAYVPCGLFCIDRVPTTASPLIDAGFTPAFFFQPWELPDTDLTGGPRQRGEQVDIGAYEGIPDVMFRDRFED